MLDDGPGALWQSCLVFVKGGTSAQVPCHTLRNGRRAGTWAITRHNGDSASLPVAPGKFGVALMKNMNLRRVLDRRKPGTVFIFLCLLLPRILSALYNIIHDCDEVYNYWEPLHFLLYGHGMQTWEYRYTFDNHTHIPMFEAIMKAPA